jgi:hypothetical protein
MQRQSTRRLRNNNNNKAVNSCCCIQCLRMQALYATTRADNDSDAETEHESRQRCRDRAQYDFNNNNNKALNSCCCIQRLRMQAYLLFLYSSFFPLGRMDCGRILYYSAIKRRGGGEDWCVPAPVTCYLLIHSVQPNIISPVCDGPGRHHVSL